MVGMNNCLQNMIRKLLPFLLREVEVPGANEVRIEAGEAVPGRTDGHVGEVNLSDRESLYGGGDRTAGPTREGLVDQEPGYSEASQDNEHPEQPEESSGGGNVG